MAESHRAAIIGILAADHPGNPRRSSSMLSAIVHEQALPRNRGRWRRGPRDRAAIALSVLVGSIAA
jgi:hypothetical protein